MRYAIISDIHANLEALQTAIKHIDEAKVDAIVCLGDVVGYGPDPNECIKLVREHCLITVKGNHDKAAIDPIESINMNRLAQEAIRWTQDRLTPESRDFLEHLPLKHIIENATLIHASPYNPDSWLYVLTGTDAGIMYEHFDTPFCFIGHSHRPAEFRATAVTGNLTEKRIINVGSVGQPRDSNPKLSFGIFDTATLEYRNVRLGYPVEITAGKIIEAGLPPPLAERLFYGL